MRMLSLSQLLLSVIFFPFVLVGQIAEQIVPIHKNVLGEVAGGYIFITPTSLNNADTYPTSLCMLDSVGNAIFFMPFTDQVSSPYPASPASDFKVQPSGFLSYSCRLANGGLGMYLLDSTFSIVDSIETINGFATDAHDLIHLPDGSFHLVGYENRTLDLSGMMTVNGVPGSEAANVLGNVLQRFDAQKNLEFEWKSLDYFALDDVAQPFFTQPDYLDHSHYNSLDIDDDGNYLLSFRHLNEITKIDAQTGEIIWHLGGKNNQFTFLGDTMPFSTQHDARRIDNGNLTLFDNGAFNSTPVARAIEYQLDEVNKTATAVWQFREPNGWVSQFTGNTDRQANGNTLIDWGGVFPLTQSTSFTEVDAEGNIVLEIDLVPDRYISYRALKQQLPFTLHRPEIRCDGPNASTLSAPDGYTAYAWNTGATTQTIAVIDTGTYQVWVNQGIGFVSSEPYQVTDLAAMCNLSQIEEPAFSTIRLYPNPATDQLFVAYTSSGRQTAQIFAASGQLMETISLEFYGQNLVNRVDISRLPAGIYFLKVGDNGERFVKHP